MCAAVTHAVVLADPAAVAEVVVAAANADRMATFVQTPTIAVMATATLELANR
jgi:hypothetical protein